ncbi:hypothetical protein K8B33_09855 [Alcanivorax sp. JB21]|uniref:hypothetical protein n=1 Tax=Alcanivorax limicola TaxID=2874102 RepID=UPI001CBF4E8A|nr:hypothetical protein [Alcanivorax limicola]MBZ2189400.1 hypothetical protein [Alcanivorax limicola]
MDEVVDALRSRIKSPYFGYAVFTFFAFNWREIYIFVMSDLEPAARIAEFDEATSAWTLAVIPLVVGVVVAAATPWIRWLFASISRRPLELSEVMQLQAENKKAILKLQLEAARKDEFALKEEELIERASRDEEVSKFKNEGAKKNLEMEIEKLRQKRDYMNESLKSTSNRKKALSEPAKELLKAAASDDRGRLLITHALNARTIHVGKRQFGIDGAKDFAKYESALGQLIELGYVKIVGNKGQIYELTYDGWEVGGAL